MKNIFKKLIVTLLVIMTLGAIALMSGCGKKVIKLEKYITISVTGYNGYATATYEFDAAKFKEDYEKKITFDDIPDDAYKSMAMLFYSDACTPVGETISEGTLSKTEGISNGDEITFTSTVNAEDLAELKSWFGYDLNADNISYKVSGLAEVISFNPFDYLTVKYEGASRNAQIVFDAASYSGVALDFYVTEGNNTVKNGDVITVEFADSYLSADEMITKYGAMASETSRQYTVEGLDEYVTSVNDIDSTTLESMKAKAESTIAANFSSNEEKMISCEFLGSYVKNVDDSSFSNYYGVSTYNSVWFVYKVKGEITGRTSFEYYTYVKWNDVSKSVDGKVNLAIDECVRSNGYFSVRLGWFTYYYYDGYKTLKEVQDSIVNYSTYEKFNITENTFVE